jgi:hypothetical protein
LPYLSHAQDAGSAADVEDDFVSEYVLVLVNRISIRPGTDFIFLDEGQQIKGGPVVGTYQHFLVNALCRLGISTARGRFRILERVYRGGRSCECQSKPLNVENIR